MPSNGSIWIYVRTEGVLADMSAPVTRTSVDIVATGDWFDCWVQFETTYFQELKDKPLNEKNQKRPQTGL